jgi:hypothetical protein
MKMEMELGVEMNMNILGWRCPPIDGHVRIYWGREITTKQDICMTTVAVIILRRFFFYL